MYKCFYQIHHLVFACQHFRPGPNRISSLFYPLGHQPGVVFGFLGSSILDPSKKNSTNACSNIQNVKHNASYHSPMGLAYDVRFDQNCGKYHYNHLFYQFFHHPSLSNATHPSVNKLRHPKDLKIYNEKPNSKK